MFYNLTLVIAKYKRTKIGVSVGHFFMKWQILFSAKNVINLSSAELAHTVVKFQLQPVLYNLLFFLFVFFFFFFFFFFFTLFLFTAAKCILSFERCNGLNGVSMHCHHS